MRHRRLFTAFEEVAARTGSVVATILYFFLMSFPRKRTVLRIVFVLCRILLARLKYVDSYLVARHHDALLVAPGSFFIGRSSDRVLSDRELIHYYQGDES